MSWYISVTDAFRHLNNMDSVVESLRSRMIWVAQEDIYNSET